MKHLNAIPLTQWEKMQRMKWPPNKRSKPMTDIEQILNQHKRKQRIIDAVVIACVMVVVWVVLCCRQAHASTNRVVDFSWTYDTTVTDLANFRLYMDDKELTIVADPKAREFTHTFSILNDAKTCFTMKAFDIAGQSSPMSPQVCIDAPPPGFESFSAKERPARATGGTGTSTITKPSGAVVAPVK